MGIIPKQSIYAIIQFFNVLIISVKFSSTNHINIWPHTFRLEMCKTTLGRVAYSEQQHILEQKLKIKLSGRKKETKLLGQNQLRWIFSTDIFY